MMKTLRIVIVEDEEEIRNSLQVLMTGAPGIAVEDAFENGERAVAFLSDFPVDVVLVDINLPGMSGIEVIARLKFRYPAMQFIVLSAYDDPDYIFKALRSGATGYMLKHTKVDQLIDAIHEVCNGGSPMSSQIARKVINEFVAAPLPGVNVEPLSRRENEILQLLARGARYKEIAATLYISTETVRSHIHRIYDKLQVHCRTEALRKTGLL